MKYPFSFAYSASLQAEQGATNQRTGIFYPGASGPYNAMLAAQTADTVLVNPTVYSPFAITLPRTITVNSADQNKKYTLDGGGRPYRIIDLAFGVGGTFEDGIVCNNKNLDEIGAGFWPNGGPYTLTLRRMVLHDCNNGILTGEHDEASILLEDVEVYDCGDFTGRSHNLYIGGIKSFIARRVYSHMVKNRGDAGVPNWAISWGHLMKIRAKESLVEFCRLLQEHGESNRPLDCPNGGKVTLRNSELELNQLAPNAVAQNGPYGQFISYGVEEYQGGNPLGLPAHELRITDNTFTNHGGPLKQLLFIKNTLPAVYTNTGNKYFGLTAPYVQGDAIYEPSASSNTFAGVT